MQLCASIFQSLQQAWLSVFLGIQNMRLTELEAFTSAGFPLTNMAATLPLMQPLLVYISIKRKPSSVAHRITDLSRSLLITN